jgi:hypothetical protein
LRVEVFAYVHAADYGELLEVQEDLTLRAESVPSVDSFQFSPQTGRRAP